IVYPSANDFKAVTSFSLAFWVKNTAQVGRTEFLFSLVDNTYGWHNSALFLLMENQTATKTTMKLGLMDNGWKAIFKNRFLMVTGTRLYMYMTRFLQK
ncbi:MAG: hypothetical protein AAB212_08990, partial [Bacteroidota bacterium]